ncbi:kinase-like domain-containing protein [Flammula alnicola]|nr:kinase-like domain-containing protein [Flammula alnicola]
MSSSSFLANYEPLDVIGNGSFGIIRKVRRKTDGLIFARKELNFERMSERDRKQISAEVNILKDLHHDHIVRYHDRYVDRDAGILYILMEYCGGGDLSTVIKQATKQNRPIPEDTIWHYFLQILHALHYCHHPSGHTRSGNGSTTINGTPVESEGSSRKAQILHRDLKPNNVFLDENKTVKLGDFGLSKVLAQASFANTYVGTPYYMTPELMQEKAYDSKSGIWSLGCLIYELCALKPLFHEAKTHSELSLFIRDGRIPPLPRGYSRSLRSSLNPCLISTPIRHQPAMRPSAAQLLQNEHLELVAKVVDAEKMLSVVMAHRDSLAAKEREIIAREQSLLETQQNLASLMAQKDHEISSLQHLVAQLRQSHSFSQQDVEMAVKQAVGRRRVAVAIMKREEEIMEAVRNREAEVDEACAKRGPLIKKEVDGLIEWVLNTEHDLRMEEARLQEVKEELEKNMKKMEQNMTKGRKEKNPVEEVKNLFEPLARMTQATPAQQRLRRPDAKLTPEPNQPFPCLQTPTSRATQSDFMPSAMKGDILTSTGKILATPSPAALVSLFNRTPKVGLNFSKIFDFEEDARNSSPPSDDLEHGDKPNPVPHTFRTRYPLCSLHPHTLPTSQYNVHKWTCPVEVAFEMASGTKDNPMVIDDE